MTGRSYFRLFLIFGVYALLSLGLILTFTQRMTNRNALQQDAKRLYRQSCLIAADCVAAYEDSSITLADFQNNLENLSDYLDAQIWIVDPQGSILLNSADPTAAQRFEQGDSGSGKPVEGFRIADFGRYYYQTGNFYNCFEKDMLTTFATITIDYQVRSYVLIHKELSAVYTGSDGYLNVAFYTSALICLLSLVTMLFFTFHLFRPLHRINKGAQAYAKGDFSQRISVSNTSELSYLANTLNYMAEELDKKEAEQKQFISNVSHDFRSPLTSIKGYIEAMLDGVIPVEFQERYLNIILFETNRLTKLTQSLLELNQFGSHGIRLNVQDFDINSMIRTTVMTFEGSCYEKKLRINLVLTGEKLFVQGDSAKIQQVLYNLIDNAVKFSKPETEIKIETNVRNEKVLVSVKDHGVGIPTASVSRVFDRFYKADQSRGRDKRGTGLGLAIVKEIITAHNENINVVSTEGVGTEFTFSLTLAEREQQ